MNKLPIIRGLNRTTEIGSDIFAPSIFLDGCNLRCPYCMNSKLVIGSTDTEISINQLEKIVQEDKAEWVIISGGEPTCTPVDLLKNLIKIIKSWGCKIGVSTNGTNNATLQLILRLIDYVALDIKSDANIYLKIGHNEDFNNLLKSRSVLAEEKNKRNDFDYEIRTTLYPPFVTRKTINNIGGIIRKDDKWILQQFRHTDNMIDPIVININPYSEEEILELLNIARIYTQNVELRYV